MSRHVAIRSLLGVIAALVAGCSPTISGPMLPRPTPSTVEVPTTTSTVVMTTSTSPSSPAFDCPTEFCLIYHIDPEASWSDGDPVTSADFAHTVTVLQNGEPEDVIGGYDLISEVDMLDAKTARVVFTAPFGPWRVLFDRLYKDGGPVDDIGELETTGPFSFVEWAEGEFLNLERTPGWWGERDPRGGRSLGEVQEIQFVFIETLEEMVDALDDGEVDVITVRPDVTTVERLREMEDVDFRLAPGPFWEHIDFHHDDPLLSQRWVRDAFSLAIDREKILNRTVRLFDPDAVGQDNTIWMGNTEEYVRHFEDGFDPFRAERILLENGCDRSENGIYVCQRTLMSFVWASTNDDPARREIFESAREDLAAIGIEIVGEFRSPSAFVTRDFLFGGPGAWQLVNFSWRARSDPYPANPTYYCDDAGTLNVNRYCSAEVERLIRETEVTVDPAERAALYDLADRIYLDDVAVIPLYQKPTLMAWTSELSGPVPNFTYSTDLWNIATWSGKDSIAIALPAEPAEIDPLSSSDDSANMIMSTLLYGAFGMSPSHEHLPLLVDSVDVINGDG